MDAQFFALKTDHNLLTVTDGPHSSSHCVVQLFLVSIHFPGYLGVPAIANIRKWREERFLL